MKVLLINPNASEEFEAAYPIGLSWVGAFLKEAGHDVLGLDGFVSGSSPTVPLPLRIDSAIREFLPDVVGLGVRNIDNQCLLSPVFYLEQSRQIVQALRRSYGGPIVLGGAGYSIFPEEALDYLQADFGIQGEGESSFLRLLEALEGNGSSLMPNPSSTIPGLAVRTEEGIRWVPNTPLPSLQGPWADRGLFAPWPYLQARAKQFPMNVQSRRGCPMECIYCTNPWLEGALMKFRPPIDVAKEIRFLSELSGIDRLTFVDSLFNHPASYTEALLEALLQERVQASWECTYNPGYHDSALLKKMQKAGCVRVSIGNESGTESILKNLKKGFGLESIEKSVQEAKKLGMEAVCFFMIGAPGENKDTVLESIRFLEKIDPSRVVVTLGIRIYPGLELARIATKEGVIPPDRKLLRPSFYLPKALKGWIEPLLLEDILPNHPNWTM